MMKGYKSNGYKTSDPKLNDHDVPDDFDVKTPRSLNDVGTSAGGNSNHNIKPSTFNDLNLAIFKYTLLI
ncbi:uncharacterized protein ASCRUDRAFT_73502 [Ascoidea rubescens DSM 1968]|uniref:Uncharacterized protein n=1 Tax=Ascoidea rubescens DSM 1968 TaxID=1344418 RepID=A0A1D2VQ77_9ASCO|nr:hypothetical protein ASCRUDRAFT_73502 [Ascoidea rubescens DSM 1968]ODV63697.1 hypothetical protein ASCRUDRAFT_73502 [Ascoidea rubescens DSM 1968]